MSDTIADFVHQRGAFVARYRVPEQVPYIARDYTGILWGPPDADLGIRCEITVDFTGTDYTIRVKAFEPLDYERAVALFEELLQRGQRGG